VSSLHAELTARVAIATAEMPWRQQGNIEEKLLELAPGRRTALIRMPPGGQLPAVELVGGMLAILVLGGDLREGPLVHSAGAYLHAPGHRALSTTRGCTLFVKQRPARRPTRRRVDTRAVVFESSHTAGLSEAPLHKDLDGHVVLLRFDPGTEIAHHVHRDGEEFFVLEGEARDELGSYPAHSWVRQPPGSSHAVSSPHGCTFFTLAHHLQNLRR